MISWAVIATEYQATETGFRERVVALFHKYEGQETDERDKRGRTVLVTQNSFALRMGLKQQTLNLWIKTVGNQHVVTSAEPEPASCINDGVPPAEGFVREVTRRIGECIPLLPYLSAETRQMIAEDIVSLRKMIDQLEASLNERSAK